MADGKTASRHELGSGNAQDRRRQLGVWIRHWDDDPVTLQEAVDIVYRGTIKVSTLRLEADRGNVEIFKVGRRQFTTLRSVREMKRNAAEIKRPEALS
jgi:hypothetical protein